MNLSEIRLHTPQTLNEALELSVKIKEACFLAGGTDLLVDIKQGLLAAKDIISLQEIKELKGIKKKNKEIRLGALVTPNDILSDSLINRYIPALADAARSMASTQIRAVATIGGNISSAVPSADLPPPLIAAEASVKLQGLESSRKVSLSEFFRGPRETACKTGELLTFILIPLLPPGTGISYLKFTLREANALAVASVASRVTLKDGKINRAAIVLGAVAPTPIMALRASEFLINREPSQSTFEKAALLAKEEGEPISDIRGSIWYRKELISVLTRRTLSEALERAQRKNRKEK
ncbi:MAG: xanthine dehydrogenase family protein subunit M [Candidatus Aminicenantes bacterium]|nr:xanthine dehydrogenase family protein subunit M [Candidatus Aminicenantes bacterium]MBL7082763.1 xanthine dehydrogenase family protein subunit M [Candidatus Aminicenantes bacterium]